MDALRYTKGTCESQVSQQYKHELIHEPGKDWFRLYTYHSLSCASGCYLAQFPPFEGCAHYVVGCWSRAQKMLKSEVLELISSISEAFARKCLNRTSRDPFCRLLEPRPENA